MTSLRSNLMTLHRSLLDAQRIDAERIGGRMSAGEVLQAAADDLRFDWLRTLSQLIASLDDAAAAEDDAAVDAATEHARSLLVAPDPDTAFGMKYLQALQDHPAVVFAHRDTVAALPQTSIRS